MKILLRLITILIGLLAIVLGEFDDSPGLQGLGLLLILFTTYRFWSSSNNLKK
ncbi:MAG: hypothetical protein RIT32_703 [Actinomycetota bacterium]|jgi:hypothetical protein